MRGRRGSGRIRANEVLTDRRLEFPTCLFSVLFDELVLGNHDPDTRPGLSYDVKGSNQFDYGCTFSVNFFFFFLLSRLNNLI